MKTASHHHSGMRGKWGRAAWVLFLAALLLLVFSAPAAHTAQASGAYAGVPKDAVPGNMAIVPAPAAKATFQEAMLGTVSESPPSAGAVSVTPTPARPPEETAAGPSPPPPPEEAAAKPSPSPPSEETAGKPAALTPGTRDVSGMNELDVNVGDFSFAPAALTGDAGQKLTLRLKNGAGTMHNISIPSQGIDKDIPPGETTSVDVTFPQSGSVEFVCKYHSAMGMKGTLQAK